MKKYISFFLIALSFSLNTNANNLTISTPIYNDGNKTVTFNVSWDNSWKLSSGPSNWDGVWVFIKRQACSNTNIWATALVSTTSGDHTTSVASGTNLLSVDAVSDGMGVFLRRTFSGMGNIATHTITLKLNGSMTTSPSITPSSADNFKIFGMEMVYVPQGQFYLGDGRQSNSYNFSAGNNAGTPLLITSAIQAAGLGAATNYTSNPMYGCPNYLPAAYPTGYNGFWCMKYEATSVSYVDFLNTLSYDQQAVRLSKWGTRYPNSVNTYFGNGGQKGSIYTSVAGTYNTIPATFTYNTSYMNYTPVIYLSWTDLTAYLDWAGLRPMNDFEFEKACRGPLNPIPNEYPWGNTSITQASGTGSNNGTFQERVSQSGEGLCFYSWNDQNWAPYRSGFAATAITTRSQAGATYYGIMEMGGNVSEQVVGGGSGYDYSNFTTANGDGALGADGNANTPGWPTGIGANQGNYCKGGDFNGYGSHPTIIQVSDRQFYGGNTYNNGQNNGTGGRGVRSFQ
jgi:formylglycine-generating enzyme required for sulfatase activity